MKQPLFPHLEKVRKRKTISDIAVYLLIPTLMITFILSILLDMTIIMYIGSIIFLVLFIVSFIYSDSANSIIENRKKEVVKKLLKNDKLT